jgi:hypothetical protein
VDKSIDPEERRYVKYYQWVCFCLFFQVWKSDKKDYQGLFVMYSHLSNKRGAHAYRFWKIPPSSKQKSTLHVYWFLRFFHPPLLVYFRFLCFVHF